MSRKDLDNQKEFKSPWSHAIDSTHKYHQKSSIAKGHKFKWERLILPHDKVNIAHDKVNIAHTSDNFQLILPHARFKINLSLQYL